MSAALSLADVSWVLQRLAIRARPDVADSSLVLIGGQALNYWCDLYRSNSPELDQHGPFSSKDLDFQATRDLIPWCSAQLGGTYALAQAGDKSLLNGIVTVPDQSGGEPLRIDFMQKPYGLLAETTTQFSATVEVHTPAAIIGIQVMHPLHCLMSRVHNVMGLPEQYATEHGLRQLNASIVCLRLFIDANAEEDFKRAQALNELVFKFALHDLDAIRLFASRRIDVFAATSQSEKLSEKFQRIRYPQMRNVLAKRRGQLPP